ncbi:MAG TPA: nucleotidyltransferase family protein [Allosphingosinicella sp.]|jgi:GTP:adenosylcobinamide-phosphate guanylyltransferase|nr:nucleotidyltransferase family protein [Allosphingosinicella sp.]
MGDWTAIVLAGRRPGENGFAASHGVPAKALIRAGGEPMLGRVARALLDSPSVARVVILAQEAESLLAGELEWMTREPRITTAQSSDGISASVGRVAGTGAAPYPVLVTTADHALLRPEMVEAFIAGADGVDAAFAMVDRKTVEKAYPDTKRTWLKAANGHFSGANLFALLTPQSMRGTDFWARAEKDRKRTLKLLSFLGLGMFLRAVTRTITLEAAAERTGRKAGFRLKAVVLPFAEAAIDVDKQADLELAERILAARAALPAAPAAASAAAAGRPAAP